jgi:glycosyltransferase involved in cell wall biosynthesis
MKILHIVPGIDPKSGGPARSITGLCRALAQSGVEVTLFVHSPEHVMSNPSGVRFLAGRGVGLMKIWQDAARVMDEVNPDIIHLHGLWMPSSHAAFCLAYRRNIPVMLSVRGGLAPWALRQKAWKKKLAMLLYQRRDLQRTMCFHATAEQEALNIRAQGLKQPICVIPNGVDLPENMPQRSQTRKRMKTALFLSRLHPGKGLLDLVQAWARTRPSGWRMRIVGPDVCGHKAEVQAEIERLGLRDVFEFIGELDDEAKWPEYVDADLFVHPSHSENFGISIAEALAAGVPVITTKGTPWQELQGSPASSKILKCESSIVGGDITADGAKKSTEDEDNSRTLEISSFRTSRCGWWIDIGVEPLVEALREAMTLTDEERYQMGLTGRRLIDAKYTWPAIGQQMKQAYEWTKKSSFTK